MLGFKYFSVATLRVESESDFEVIKEMEIESDLVRSENSLKNKSILKLFRINIARWRNAASCCQVLKERFRDSNKLETVIRFQALNFTSFFVARLSAGCENIISNKISIDRGLDFFCCCWKLFTKV